MKKAMAKRAVEKQLLAQYPAVTKEEFEKFWKDYYGKRTKAEDLPF